ncbi:MAG: TatD family hydrolase [Chloroflexi bacterium]|nr:TatD family hydrolase [Chloroflexota bacterium]
MIDTHCHLNFDSYADDLDAVIARAAAAGVTRVVIPAIDLETSRDILGLCSQHDGLFAAVGIHPNSSADFTPALLKPLGDMAAYPKVVAIGEIGLDYYWDKSPKPKQFETFESQLTLAAKLALPVIIHNREAGADIIDILESWVRGLPDSLKTRPGVLHSFSAPADIAERALEAGFYIGFTGPITYKKADDLRAVAARVPPDRLLVETDGPFLTPTPHRGQRNEPAYIPYIIERLAALHQVTVEQMAQTTTENAARLFALP